MVYRQIQRPALTALMRALRLILPLGAVVLLSTVFLVSRSVDPQRAIDLADIDIVELTREPRIGTARVAGVTRENSAIVIEAVTMRSASDLNVDAALRLNLDTPVGELQFPTGRRVTFRAELGEIDAPRDMVRM